jgi:hypothetical protein
MAKGKVKTIIVALLVGLLVLILIAAVLFKLFGNQMIRKGVVAGSEKALQVGVRLDSVDLKLLAGEATLSNMEIDNPEGYQHPTFLKMGSAYMDLNVQSLMSDTIEMTMLRLDDLQLVIEQKGLTNNLKEILNNLPKAEPTEPEPAEKEKGKDVRINVLEINNIEVKAKLLPIPGRADTVTLRVKPIRLENIGTNEKINAAELTAKILKAIAAGVAEQGRDLLPVDMIGSVTEELGKQGQELLKAGQEAGEGLLEGTKDIGKGAADTIKGIGDMFQKKEEE